VKGQAKKLQDATKLIHLSMQDFAVYRFDIGSIARTLSGVWTDDSGGHKSEVTCSSDDKLSHLMEIVYENLTDFEAIATLSTGRVSMTSSKPMPRYMATL